MKLQKQEWIWLVGCSSGIGEALALALDKLGHRLILSARRKDALEALSSKLQTTAHLVLPLDVSDTASIDLAFDTLQTSQIVVHRIFYLCALYQPQSICDVEMDDLHRLFQVNLYGAFYFGKHAPCVLHGEHAQMVFFASVAGFIGMPQGQPYSASKAALINFVESYAIESDDYIDVKLVNSGFVKTPLTDVNTFVMPMRISAENAALRVIEGIEKRKFEIQFPKRFTFFVRVISMLPYRFSFSFLSILKK